MLSICTLFSLQFNESLAVSFKEENNSNIYLDPTYRNFESDVITIDWSTPESVPQTYWAVHNFHGGYAGFQDQGDNKKTFHFALWDAVDDTDDKIKVEYVSPITDGSSFGGEGTGMKAATVYPWEENEWYTMVIRNWHEDGRTKYGQWVKKPDGTWLLTAILDHPDGTYTMNTSSMFQEDYWGPKEETRSFKLKNHYSLDTNTREWHSYDEKYISNNRGAESDVWDGGATSEYFWGKVGPKVSPSIPDNTKLKIEQPATPDIPKIELDSFKVNIKNNQLKANWRLTEMSSPQFKANLMIKNNGEVKQVFDSVKAYEQTFSSSISNFDAAAGDIICLSVTDVYNNTKEFVYEDSLDLEFNINEDVVENIRLLGIYEQRASELNLECDGQLVYKKENSNWPNNDRTGDYMGLTIIRDGEEIYRKILDAKDDQMFSDTIQLEKGDIIDIYHEEPSNIFSMNKKLINFSSKHNLIEYTGAGYVNKDIYSEDTEETSDETDTVEPSMDDSESTSDVDGNSNTSNSSDVELENSSDIDGNSNTSNSSDAELENSSDVDGNSNMPNSSDVGSVNSSNPNQSVGETNSSQSEEYAYEENYSQYQQLVENNENSAEKLPNTGDKQSIYIYILGIGLLCITTGLFIRKRFSNNV